MADSMIAFLLRQAHPTAASAVVLDVSLLNESKHEKFRDRKGVSYQVPGMFIVCLLYTSDAADE